MNDPRWTAGRLASILLADRQHIFLEGMRQVLQRSSKPQCKVIGQFNRVERLVDSLSSTRADLVILDPAPHGPTLIAKIHRLHPHLRIIVVSNVRNQREAQRYLTSGAAGFVSKSGPVDDLQMAIRQVLDGGTFLSKDIARSDANGQQPKDQGLTRREVEVLRLITEGFSNKDIGKQLFISDQTVSVHRKNIMRKMSVRNTAALVRTAFEQQLI